MNNTCSKPKKNNFLTKKEQKKTLKTEAFNVKNQKKKNACFKTTKLGSAHIKKKVFNFINVWIKNNKMPKTRIEPATSRFSA